MTNCPKFVEMQKMFHGRYVAIVEVQLVVATQIVATYVNVVDVNVTIKNKAIEEQMFKDKEPRKAKSAINLEKEEHLKKTLVKTIQQKSCRPKQKSHPHPWKDGTKPSRVCQILFLWKQKNIKK
jgi:hypothetical protein